MTDTERLDWLAERCYLPGDHPDKGILVVVDEQAAPLGSFSCGRENDRAALRAAIDRMIALESNAHGQPRLAKQNKENDHV